MAVAVACALELAAVGQTPSDEAKVSAWATGGTSATAKPGDSDGKPMGGAVAMPYWQAPATPQAVIQGGAILAVAGLYWNKVRGMAHACVAVTGLVRKAADHRQALRLLRNLVAAFIPAAAFHCV
jgi:hypothetical protein